ncbi:RagB/SusD family nutrient uptake outer membrane protein [Flavobacterium selenitireducens]|uniref:RagB/SusD family nutrient uptake outer membrane protein n=1 Tax=Flavobacterium selenitireducens TaxID=2722704 RepID=UPI00168B79C1|nr:RagB/SusD family nutrient uptake outer membrane protein [Flavobacterium selenitireducens]MBD3583120.1 RagB/SusD family nutrient uptake outer membrane protein [Flavobacterium selenitireducens]
MKKIKFSLLFLVMTAFTFQSCINDLEVEPLDDDTFLSEKFFASSPDSYKQGLAGIYGNLTLTGANGPGSSPLQGIDAGTSQFGRCLLYLQTLTSDEMIWSYENDAGTRELQRNIWTSENPILLGMFSRIMLEVAYVNEYLRQTTPEKLSARGVTDAALIAEIETYRNEVRALRAYSYYVMMDLFGKAPMVTENDPINFRAPQVERAELFEFVETELNAVLPNLKDAGTNEYGRLDKAFAQMVLAKIFLNAEVYIGANRYSDCLTQCNNIIGSGAFSLQGNYLNNFNADNHTSPEMIFTLQSDGIRTQNYGATTTIVNGEVGSVEANGAQLGVTPGWGGALRLRRQMVEKFDGSDFDFDVRKQIISGDRPIDITNIANQGQGFITTKYTNITSGGVVGSNQVFVDTDFPLFRLADVYLMATEASLRGGGAFDGLTYINALRTRSGAGTITAGELNLPFIIDERLRELYWESHRRQDLIRFGRYTGGAYNWAWKGNALSGVAIPATYSVFPLPAQSIAANPNLTQNSGY